jgi:SAM-dependent methyltransferase
MIISPSTHNTSMENHADHRAQNYQTLIKTAVLDEASFIHLTFSNKLREDGTPWIKIKIRPVLIKGKRQLQFSYFDPKKDITKNYSGAEIEESLDKALALAFGQINLQATSGDIQIRITTQGKVVITRGKPAKPEAEPNLAHNHSKKYPLNADNPDPFLQEIGIMNRQGKILAPMQDKFIQINEFLRIIGKVLTDGAGQTAPVANNQPIEIIDCGCGSAYLTFAAYHFLHNIRNLPVHLTGIDYNSELISKCNRLRDTLGWSGLEFHVANIAEFEPSTPPGMVLSLHACDTATDQVIAKGILWQAQAILAVPCCQHELHNQLNAPLFRPVLRHGILKERLSDLLTDTFRALILRIMGYNTAVIEFIAPEHTAKNLLIRAERGAKPGEADLVKEYLALKDFWQVEPAIEGYIGEPLRAFLTAGM